MVSNIKSIAFFLLILAIGGCATPGDYSRISQVGEKLEYGANASMRVAQVIQIGKAESIRSDAILINMATATAAGAGAGALVNNDAAKGAATGLAVGLVAGLIHGVNASAAVDCLTITSGWGPRMECATALSAHAMPALPTLYMDETLEQRGWISQVATIKGDTAIFNAVIINQNRNPVVYKMIGKYKGETYRNKYPAAEGWEFRVDTITVGKGLVTFDSWGGLTRPIKEAMNDPQTPSPLESIGVKPARK